MPPVLGGEVVEGQPLSSVVRNSSFSWVGFSVTLSMGGVSFARLATGPVCFVLTRRIRRLPSFSRSTTFGYVSAARGDTENRLKELHHDLAFGRTSCSRFWANQLRVLLSAAAYVLLQGLQRRATRTTLARAQVGRLRLALLKVGVQIVRSVRRLDFHFPRAHPHVEAWRTVALGLGAVTRRFCPRARLLPMRDPCPSRTGHHHLAVCAEPAGARFHPVTRSTTALHQPPRVHVVSRELGRAFVRAS